MNKILTVVSLCLKLAISTSSRGKYPLTELDQKTLFSSITKFNDSLDNPASLPAQMRAAFRAMTKYTKRAIFNLHKLKNRTNWNSSDSSLVLLF